MPVRRISVPRQAQRSTASGAYSGARSMEMPSQLGGIPSPRKLLGALKRVEQVERSIRRVEPDTLYSAYLIPITAPVGPYDVFVTARGAAGQGFAPNSLTQLETNLENGGRVPDEYAYVLHTVAITLDPTPFVADPDGFMEAIHRMALSYSLLEKEKLMGPIWMFPGGGGVAGAEAAGVAALSNGVTSFAAQATLAEPIVLTSGTTFKFTLNVSGAGGGALKNKAAFRCWVKLSGIRASYVKNG